MKRVLTILAALLMLICPAGAEDAPATYAEVRAQYGLPEFTPCNFGVIIAMNSVAVTEVYDDAFTRGAITYTGDDGETVTVEGVRGENRWDWPEITTGETQGNVWSLRLPADAAIELTGDVPCAEGYRCAVVYRRLLQHDSTSAMMAFAEHLENTGLRLYDPSGAKVLEVWPKAGEYELRCMAVTFYPADGKEYTVEYLPDPGDVEDEDYTRMAQELTAGNAALAHPAKAPDTLSEALTFFPQADLTLDFIPAFDPETGTLSGFPADMEVLYAQLQLRDEQWMTASGWRMAPDGEDAYVLADPDVLPRMKSAMTGSTLPCTEIFYRDENGLVLYGQYVETVGWYITLQATTPEGYVALSMTPYEAQLSCSDKAGVPLWHAAYDLTTGEQTWYFEE